MSVRKVSLPFTSVFTVSRTDTRGRRTRVRDHLQIIFLLCGQFANNYIFVSKTIVLQLHLVCLQVQTQNSNSYSVSLPWRKEEGRKRGRERQKMREGDHALLCHTRELLQEICPTSPVLVKKLEQTILSYLLVFVGKGYCFFFKDIDMAYQRRRESLVFAFMSQKQLSIKRNRGGVETTVKIRGKIVNTVSSKSKSSKNVGLDRL